MKNARRRLDLSPREARSQLRVSTRLVTELERAVGVSRVSCLDRSQRSTNVPSMSCRRLCAAIDRVSFEPIVLGRAVLERDLATLHQPTERGVKRSLLDHEHIVRALFGRLGDRVPVRRRGPRAWWCGPP